MATKPRPSDGEAMLLPLWSFDFMNFANFGSCFWWDGGGVPKGREKEREKQGKRTTQRERQKTLQ